MDSHDIKCLPSFISFLRSSLFLPLVFSLGRKREDSGNEFGVSLQKLKLGYPRVTVQCSSEYQPLHMNRALLEVAWHFSMVTHRCCNLLCFFVIVIFSYMILFYLFISLILGAPSEWSAVACNAAVKVKLMATIIFARKYRALRRSLRSSDSLRFYLTISH